MELVTCQLRGKVTLGVLQGNNVILPYLKSSTAPNMLSLIEQAPSILDILREIVDTATTDITVSVNEVQMLAPIPYPRQNILCLGWNYADHIEETTASQQLSQKELPKHPIVFTKDVSTVNGPYDDIPYDPDVSTKLDWEVELAVYWQTGI